MGAGRHAFRGFTGGQAGAEREAAADRLGNRHDVRRDPGALIGEQLAGAPDAGLNLIEHQQQPVLIAQSAQLFQDLRRSDAHPALALDRLDQDRRGLRPELALDRLEIRERYLIEAFERRTKPFQVFLLPARRERRQRAAVKRPLEGDDPKALGLAADRVILARGLDRAFECLGAGIGEEHQVGERRRAQPFGEPLSLRNAEQVGDVPELLRLLAERLDQMRMRVTERVHRHAGREIEIALAVRRDEPSAVTPLEGEIGARVGGQEMRGHDPSNASGVPK